MLFSYAHPPELHSPDAPKDGHRPFSIIKHLPFALGTLLAPLASQALSVPTGFDDRDGPSLGFLAGVWSRAREQVLIDAVHLTPLVGRTIEGLWLRHDGNDHLARTGGQVDLTVRISATSVPASGPSSRFASNRGPDVVTAFQGRVVVPADRGQRGDPWADDQTVRVTFATPFAFGGGNLCLEIEGTPVTESFWWPLDGVIASVDGVEVSFGEHCQGFFTDKSVATLRVNDYGLVPGATALFVCYGRLNTPGLLMLGVEEIAGGLDLEPIGMTGCRLLVKSLVTMPGVFDMKVPPMPVTYPGGALFHVDLPFDPALLRARLSAQAINLETGPQKSNPVGITLSQGLRVTLASRVPTLGICTIESRRTAAGLPFPEVGEVRTDLGPIVRFLYR